MDRVPTVAKFFVVGIATTMVDWGMYYVLINFIEYHIALTVAMGTAAIINFQLNRTRTFKKEDKMASRASTFFIIFAISFALSQAIISLLVFLVNSKIAARVMTTFIIFVFNYFMHKKITFR